MNLRPILRNATILLHDVLMAGIAYAVALSVRMGPEEWADFHLQQGALAFLLYLGICGATFFHFGLHRGVWRYTSLHDMTVIVRAVIITTLLFVGAAFLITRANAVPRSLPLMLLFILPCLLAASRIGYRLLREKRLSRLWQTTSNSGAQPILLLGANDEAESFIRTAARDPHSAWNIVGVIDDKGTRIGRMIHNVTVVGGIADLPTVMEKLSPRPVKLILTRAPDSYPSDVLRRVMDLSNTLDLPLGRLPSLAELNTALAAASSLVRPVAVEDLLGRAEIVLQQDKIAALVAGRRVIVTGAGGSIGSELVRQIAALNPHKLVLMDNGEFNLYTIDQEIRTRHTSIQVHTILADVRDRTRVESIFITEQPEVVFHAAALKHVPLVEANIREAVLTNVQGSKNVADAARQVQAQALVMISSDKAINPTNIMGATKRIAEAYCQTLDLMPGSTTRFMTVRFGNVLGSSGSVVPLFQKQLERGGPLTVTHPDVTRYFMTVREAVALVLQASAYGLGSGSDRGKIFVLDMGQPVKIVDLARQMIRLAGFRPDDDIKIEFTGLRPGEKLYEELFGTEEMVQAGVDGVLVAAPRVLDASTLAASIAALSNEAAANANDGTLTAAIHALVPEYERADTTSSTARAQNQ
jgi:FlaA1/EpsC-like NDP-sugar epimerase